MIDPTTTTTTTTTTPTSAAVRLERFRYSPPDIDLLAHHIVAACALARSPTPTQILGVLAVHKAEALREEDLLQRASAAAAATATPTRTRYQQPAYRNPALRELYLFFLPTGNDPAGVTPTPPSPPALANEALARSFGFGVVGEEGKPAINFWMRPPATTTTAAAAGVEAVSVAAVRADDASVDAVPTAALAAVVQLLRAAQRLGERIEGASSVPPIFVPGVDAPMARALKAAPAELCRVVWDEEEGYLVHALDADAERAVWDEYGDKAALGRRWVDPTDGETYVVDTLRASDYDAIVSGSTVDYDDEYIRHLLSEPFRGLSRGIRKVAPASAEATTAEATTTDSNTNTNTTTDVSSAPLVSWCMTHRDLGTGLLSTVPTHRGRGFARLCAAAVVLAQSEFLAALREGEARWASTGTVRPSPPPPPPPQEVLGGGGVGGAAGAGAGAGAGARPHCYIVKGNAASKATMRGLGFREVEGLHEVTWMGVRPAMGG